MSSTEPNIETFKNQYDWFVAASTLDGQRQICTREDFQIVLREDILAGRLRAKDLVRVYKKKGGGWAESTSSLRDFAQQHSKLRAVYEPVWAHAITGCWWGVLAGIGLAMLNSIIIYSKTDPLVAILGASVLAHFIPRFGRNIAMVPFGLLGLMGKMAPVFGILTGMILFAILGAVSGMTIGGAIGWNWEDRLPRAPGAPVEAYVAIKSVVLPLLGSLLLWGVYILVLYPLAMHMAGSPLTFWRTPSQP